MGWTKRQLIQAAYRKIGLANYVYDLSPEQLQDACFDMDSMVATWEGKGIRIGYSSSDTPGAANIDADSGVPSYCNAAIYLNLAIVIASDIGKAIPASLAVTARGAYLVMLQKSLPPTLEYQFPSTLPRGAGQKPWRSSDPFMNNPYTRDQQDQLDTGPEGEFELDN